MIHDSGLFGDEAARGKLTRFDAFVDGVELAELESIVLRLKMLRSTDPTLADLLCPALEPVTLGPDSLDPPKLESGLLSFPSLLIGMLLEEGTLYAAGGGTCLL